jgi:hypothetical protein
VQDRLAAIFILLFLVFGQAAYCKQRKETGMKDLISINVTCKDNPQCYFKDEDLFIVISITNTHDKPIGVPLEFVKDRGPVVRLVDTTTGADTFLPTHPADSDLLDEFLFVEPGKSISMEWVFDPEEMRQFGHKYVDLSAEVTIMADILVEGKKMNTKVSHLIRIVSKDKPKDERPLV